MVQEFISPIKLWRMNYFYPPFLVVAGQAVIRSVAHQEYRIEVVDATSIYVLALLMGTSLFYRLVLSRNRSNTEKKLEVDPRHKKLEDPQKVHDLNVFIEIFVVHLFIALLCFVVMNILEGLYLDKDKSILFLIMHYFSFVLVACTMYLAKKIFDFLK